MADAAPGSPIVTRVEPDQLPENLGSGTGARAIPIVIVGQDFKASATITAEPPNALIFEGSTVVSADGTLAARLARVPIDTTAGAGTSKQVTVIVTQDGLTGSGTIEIDGLDELVLNVAMFNAAMLAPRYSRITARRQ